MSDRDTDIDYLAELAHLHLDARERDGLREQLDRILGYVRQLEAVDVDDVPPTSDVLGRSDVLRADEPGESLPREEVLAAAPASEEDRFLVPGMLPT